MNGGASWTTNTDFLTVIGCSDVVIDPANSNIMYLATGDGENGATRSLGVLKSTDGGTNWNATGLSFAINDYISIHKLALHPTNSNILFAATEAFSVYPVGSSVRHCGPTRGSPRQRTSSIKA